MTMHMKENWKSEMELMSYNSQSHASTEQLLLSWAQLPRLLKIPHFMHVHTYACLHGYSLVQQNDK